MTRRDVSPSGRAAWPPGQHAAAGVLNRGRTGGHRRAARVAAQQGAGVPARVQPTGRPADGLSPEEVERYSRHLILPEVGLAGQKKICSTSVLCIGAGGLGNGNPLR